MSNFHHVLVNTLIANVTTSYLWFALTFWVYLETGNVGLTGVLNGLYMGLIAVGSIFFGSIVDHNRKKSVMMFAAVATLVCFAAAAAVWVAGVTPGQVDARDPALLLFAAFVLFGAVVEHMRNIALSTTVTLMVPEDERDKANGLVGAVQGAAFFATSILSGVSIGFLGMETTMWIALALTVVALIHLIPVKIPEHAIITSTAATSDGPSETTVSAGIDLRGSWRIILAVPGLLALILFSSFNNLVGGVYTALMDPYGLEMFSPQIWGLVLGLTSLGFIFGGAIVSRVGLGKNPVRTLLLVNVGVALLGMVFGLREWWWLYAGGIFLFMLTIPAAEAAEQTILQRVVPFRQQGRVFGLAMAVEMAANPLSTIVVAIIAQAYIIPWMAGPGSEVFGWLLGEGSTRGMALMFVISGAIMLVVVLLAFASRPYRKLSDYYASTSQDLATD
ncbi:Major Facilitator Superfamily protein [Corynebacterium atrinae]|uniref:MFS transporter n=1 Tax=Corynebacterium atrinae TaxID=1336740 RepID=UPI0025B48998|nr:MFS transporter [Corynebacterium atrinae]WJY64438.1 Major Facilitator Superfamily protein [Corynebacterium atrinae]